MRAALFSVLTATGAFAATLTVSPTGFNRAEAAVVKAFDLPTLTRKADLVVVGTVTHTAARWVEGRIVTRVTLTPSQVLKGSPGETVTIEVLGGEVDGIGQLVSGMARFEVGEETVVFLERAAETHRVVGLAQGKFRVERGPTGVALVPDLTGLTAATRDAQGQVVLAPLGADTPVLTLQRFVGLVSANLTATP